MGQGVSSFALSYPDAPIRVNRAPFNCSKNLTRQGFFYLLNLLIARGLRIFYSPLLFFLCDLILESESLLLLALPLYEE